MENKLRTLSEVVDWINKDIADHEKEFRDNPPPFVKGAMTALKNLKFFIDIPTTGKQPTNEPILRWVNASERLPPENKLVHCKTTRGRAVVTSAAKGEWDNYSLDEEMEAIEEWLDESPLQSTKEKKEASKSDK